MDPYKDKLDEESYAVLREGSTERPFSGEYVDHHENGVYRCKACNAALFPSGTKFDSGTGWPSFTDPANTAAVTLIEDRTHGMHRTEVRCASCDSHLGHVFLDGPKEQGGKRFCINSCALDFSAQ